MKTYQSLYQILRKSTPKGKHIYVYQFNVKPPGFYQIRAWFEFEHELMNYESQFIESQWKHAVSHMKMPAVRDSASSLISSKAHKFDKI